MVTLIGPSRPNLTPNQRHVLSRLADGAELWIDHGDYLLEGCVIGCETVKHLVIHGMMTCRCRPFPCSTCQPSPASSPSSEGRSLVGVPANED